jgi:hypothetical protein
MKSVCTTNIQIFYEIQVTGMNNFQKHSQIKIIILIVPTII